jgi:uncharacterized protein
MIGWLKRLALIGLLSHATLGSAATLLDGIRAYDAGRHGAAFEIFEDLALNGNPRAQAWTGYLYERGEGVVANLQEAARWYMEGA